MLVIQAHVTFVRGRLRLVSLSWRAALARSASAALSYFSSFWEQPFPNFRHAGEEHGCATRVSAVVSGCPMDECRKRPRLGRGQV